MGIRQNKGGRPFGQPALAVPATPLRVDGPTGFDQAQLPEDTRFEYQFSAATFERGERHDWSIIRHGIGAIGVWCKPSSLTGDWERWYGGIEVHYGSPPDHADYCGHQEHCWLLEGPCWTDGSSLQFSEEIEARLPAPYGGPLGMDAIEAIMPILLHRYEAWLGDALAAATVTAKTPQAVECEASQSGLKGNAQPSSGNSNNG